MRYQRFDEPGRLDLAKIPTDPPKGASKDEAEQRLAVLGQELFELQDLLWGARTHSVLVILQGRDTAGKDGAIKHVAGYLNPRGVSVASFGVPSEEERSHDFLWRVHREAPPKGAVAIFNRSHYEDVLVVRVNHLAPEALWRARYPHINGFESLLAEEGTIVVKYFLHISKDEQGERLLAREQDLEKTWKLSVGDWRDREKWDAFTEAYEDAIGRCAATHAPWIVVPANAKWYRNLVVAETLVEALRPYRKGWQKALDEIGLSRRAELQAYRAAHGGKK